MTGICGRVLLFREKGSGEENAEIMGVMAGHPVFWEPGGLCFMDLEKMVLKGAGCWRRYQRSFLYSFA